MSFLSPCGCRDQAGRREGQPAIPSSSLRQDQNNNKSRAAAGGEGQGLAAEKPGIISQTAPGQDTGTQQKPAQGGKDPQLRSDERRWLPSERARGTGPDPSKRGGNWRRLGLGPSPLATASPQRRQAAAEGSHGLRRARRPQQRHREVPNQAPSLQTERLRPAALPTGRHRHCQAPWALLPSTLDSVTPRNQLLTTPACARSPHVRQRTP